MGFYLNKVITIFLNSIKHEHIIKQKMLLREKEEFIRSDSATRMIDSSSDSTLANEEIKISYGKGEEKKNKCQRRLKMTICVLVLLFIGVTGCSLAVSMFVLPSSSGAHDVSADDLMTPELEKDMEETTPPETSEEKDEEVYEENDGDYWKMDDEY